MNRPESKTCRSSPGDEITWYPEQVSVMGKVMGQRVGASCFHSVWPAGR